jgi:hypothetical protein
MEIETETPTPQQAAKQWFEVGRDAALKTIENMPTSTKGDLQAKTDAYEKFVREDAFYGSVKPDGSREAQRASQHPAIESAIDQYLAADPAWKEQLGRMPDEELQDQWLKNRLADLQADGRLSERTTLPEFKASDPRLVGYAAKMNRTQLERRVTLHHMVNAREFDILQAKKNWLDEGLRRYPEVRIAANTEVSKAAKETRMTKLDRSLAFVKSATKKLIQKEEQTRGARV